MTITDTIRAALDTVGIRDMPIVQTGDGRVEVYVSSIHGAETFSAVGAAIWFVRH